MSVTDLRFKGYPQNLIAPSAYDGRTVLLPSGRRVSIAQLLEPETFELTVTADDGWKLPKKALLRINYLVDADSGERFADCSLLVFNIDGLPIISNWSHHLPDSWGSGTSDLKDSNLSSGPSGTCGASQGGAEPEGSLD